MGRPRVHRTNAERQAAYRERKRQADAEWAAARAERERLLSDALVRLDSWVAYGARLGDGDCLELAKHDRAGKVSLLAQWLKEGAERDADRREADRRGSGTHLS